MQFYSKSWHLSGGSLTSSHLFLAFLGDVFTGHRQPTCTCLPPAPATSLEKEGEQSAQNVEQKETE